MNAISGIAGNQEAIRSAATSSVVVGELIIRLNFHDLGFSEFMGSRAMLEGEGVIPEGFEWPEGDGCQRWSADGLDYWIYRQRPEGAKGPKRDFLNVDWWCLRWELTNAPCPSERAIMIKTKALKDEIYRHSEEGRMASRKLFERYWKSTEDEKFQVFKALVPGLVKPKRGRPLKAAISIKEH